VDDPIKYKLRSYIQYGDGNFAGAKENMDKFLSQADKSRVQPSDEGLQGLIAAGLAKTETDEAKKAQLNQLSQQKIAIAKTAKDETLKWDEELAKIKGGITTASVSEGATNPAIEALKAKVAVNPKDTDALYQLAQEYQNVQNWNGAILTWGTSLLQPGICLSAGGKQ